MELINLHQNLDSWFPLKNFCSQHVLCDEIFFRKRRFSFEKTKTIKQFFSELTGLRSQAMAEPMMVTPKTKLINWNLYKNNNK